MDIHRPSSVQAVHPDRQTRLLYLFVALSLILGTLSGLLAVYYGHPLYILLGLVGLIAFVIAIFSVEFGLYALLFLSYTRLSDIGVHIYGTLSIAKVFIPLVILAIFIRTTIFRKPPLGWQKATILIGAYGLIGFASIFYAPAPSLVLQATSDFIKNAIIAILIVILLQEGQAFRRAIWVLVLTGVFLGSLSVFQFMTKTFSNHYWGFAMAGLEQIVGQQNAYRIGGPIGDPNFFAQIMVVIVPISLERFIHERRTILKGLALWSFIVSTLCVIFSYSRGGFLALAVAGGGFLLVYPPRVYQMPVLIISLLVLTFFVPPNYYDRLLTLNEFITTPGSIRTSDLALRGRATENLTAIEMIKNHPFFGVGLHNYAYLYNQYAKSIGISGGAAQKAAHDLYLEVTAETGIVGLTVFLALIGASLRSILIARKKFLQDRLFDYAGLVTGFGFGLFGYLVAAFFVHAAFPRYFYLLIGIALSLDMVVKNVLNAPQQSPSGYS